MEIDYAIKYMSHRKENVIKLRTLIEKKKQLHKEIKTIEQSLNGWDNALINYSDKK